MRLRAAVAAIMLLAMGSIAPAGAARPRRALLPYDLQDRNHHFTVPPAHAGSWEQEDAYDFPLRKGENAVSVMVLDDRRARTDRRRSRRAATSSWTSTAGSAADREIPHPGQGDRAPRGERSRTTGQARRRRCVDR
jgi:hypothetical protein